MLEMSSIKALNISGEDYVSLSPKYSRHLDEYIHQSLDNPYFTFLYGEPGSGKSTVLENEFFIPLFNDNFIISFFNFSPNERLKNHQFSKKIIFDCIKQIKKKSEFSKKQKENISNFEDVLLQSANTNILKKSDISNFFDHISSYKHNLKIAFIFEDVHLSNQRFTDFLEILNLSNAVNIKVIATSRKNDKSHDYKFLKHKKWIRVNKFNEKNVFKFLETNRFSSPSISSESLVRISAGNPYSMQEIRRYYDQNNGFNDNILEDLLFKNVSKGPGFITYLRYSKLSEEHKAILKALSLLGFKISESLFLNIVKYLNIRDSKILILDLKKQGFLSLENGVLSFKHHLMYECVSRAAEEDKDIVLARKLFFYFLRNDKKEFEKLVNLSRFGELFSYACYFSKVFADNLYAAGRYEVAVFYYEQYMANLHFCSRNERLQERYIKVLKPLHDCYLILGNDQEAKKVETSLKELSLNVSDHQHLKILSLLARSNWNRGKYLAAQDILSKTLILESIHRYKDIRISSLVRLGSILSELGGFEEALDYYDQSLKIIDNDISNKYDLFVKAHANVKSVESICLAELGRANYLKDNLKEISNTYKSESDQFTKLFICAHTTYAIFLSGNIKLANELSLDGINILSNTKASLLGPAVHALNGISTSYLGQTRAGLNQIKLAITTMEDLCQGHKRAMIDLFLCEALLLNFDLNEFNNQIDNCINRAKQSGQLAYVGWMYFIKAIYFAFFQRSTTGFVGALAKSNMVAQSLKMKTLENNILSLSNLEQSKVMAFGSSKTDLHFLDKSQFFYNLTKAVKPISFHKED